MPEPSRKELETLVERNIVGILFNNHLMPLNPDELAVAVSSFSDDLMAWATGKKEWCEHFKSDEHGFYSHLGLGVSVRNYTVPNFCPDCGKPRPE